MSSGQFSDPLAYLAAADIDQGIDQEQRARERQKKPEKGACPRVNRKHESLS